MSNTKKEVIKTTAPTRKEPALVTVEAVNYVTLESAYHIPGDRFQISPKKAEELKAQRRVKLV